MRHSVGTTKNGVEVYARLINSKVGKRLSRQPQLLALAKEVLADSIIRGPSVSMETDMRRQIGYDFVVKTTDRDTIFYAQLPKDDIYTRFVKNGEPVRTGYLTVILQRDGDKNYELTDVWIGRLTPPRPGSDDETIESKSFWANYANTFRDQSLQMSTLTKTCPY